MTDAKSDNWYPDGENAARITEDLLPATVTPEAAGAAAEEIFDAGGREAFLFPIFRSKVWEIGKLCDAGEDREISILLIAGTFPDRIASGHPVRRNRWCCYRGR
jgi:hypothetical protein